MSADNEIYILTTKRGRNKKEYRVIHTQAIENVLLYEPDHFPGNKPRLNEHELIRYFGKARVFTDRKIAEGYAMRWLDERSSQDWITEYGIGWLEYPHVRFPRVHDEESCFLCQDEEERQRKRHDIFPDGIASWIPDAEYEDRVDRNWQ